MTLPKPDPWRWIEADSRAVEVVTALHIAAAGAACWAGGWFGGWMPSLYPLSGFEAGITILTSTIALMQIYAVALNIGDLRWFCSMIASAIFSAFGAILFTEYGFSVPGGPLFTLAAVVQLWACLSIASDMRRHD